MHSAYRTKRKCRNPACLDCYPETWDDDGIDTGPAWWAGWTIIGAVVFVIWAVWFVTSGAVRP